MFRCSFCGCISLTQIGVKLTECSHSLCRECLGALVRGTMGDTVLCPCDGEGPSCGRPIQHSDIKKGVDKDTYDNFLKQSMRLYKWYCQCPDQFFVNPGLVCPICNKTIYKQGECSQVSEKVNPNHTVQENKILNVKAYCAFLNNNGQNKVIEIQDQSLTCDSCMTNFKLTEKVKILKCSHVYCKDCIHFVVNYDILGNFNCPYLHCETFIPCWELKNFLNTGNEPLKQSFRENEPAVTLPKRISPVLCPNSDCKGWFAVFQDTEFIICKVCNNPFCIFCKCRHNPTILTCEEYQRTLNNPDQYTLDLLEEMLKDERALKCPGCDALIEKDAGCDWVKCSSCDTEICWVTRGPRWGPQGVGDTSAGCRCREGGAKCHPNCKNCH